MKMATTTAPPATRKRTRAAVAAAEAAAAAPASASASGSASASASDLASSNATDPAAPPAPPPPRRALPTRRRGAAAAAKASSASPAPAATTAPAVAIAVPAAPVPPSQAPTTATMAPMPAMASIMTAARATPTPPAAFPPVVLPPFVPDPSFHAHAAALAATPGPFAMPPRTVIAGRIPPPTLPPSTPVPLMNLGSGIHSPTPAPNHAQRDTILGALLGNTEPLVPEDDGQIVTRALTLLPSAHLITGAAPFALTDAIELSTLSTPQGLKCIITCGPNRAIIGFLPEAYSAAIAPLVSARRITIKASIAGPPIPVASLISISVEVWTTTKNDAPIRDFFRAIRLCPTGPTTTPMPSSAIPIKPGPSSSLAGIASAAIIPAPCGTPTTALSSSSFLVHAIKPEPTRPLSQPNGQPPHVKSEPWTNAAVRIKPDPGQLSSRPLVRTTSLPAVPQSVFAANGSAAAGALGTTAAPGETTEEPWQQLLRSSADWTEKSSTAIMDSMVAQATQDLANLPEAPQPPGLISTLLPYQRQGLGWLLEAEHPHRPTETEESQFWLIKRVNGLPVWYNAATNAVAQGEVRLYRGGILADDMGLGKTIQVIALILTDPNGAGFAKEPNEVSSAYSNATLIVCPVSVIGNWLQQIGTHVELNRLKVYVYHGQSKNKDPKFLQSHDIVITTYNVLGLCGINDSPMHKVRWRRIVLDEGHQIRQKATKMSQAACSLTAERKWVLSGTPLQNKLEDLYSQLKFVEFFPWDNWTIFKQYFERPIKSGNADALARFKALMCSLCLRRTKGMRLAGKPLLELPEMRQMIHKVPFSLEEREIYMRWEAKTRLTLEEIMKDAAARERAKQLQKYGIGSGPISRPTRDGEDGAAVYNLGSMLKYLTRLRQLCNHRILAEKDKAPKGGGKAKLMRILRDHAAEDCAICLAPMRNPAITLCGHYFCLDCIQQELEMTPGCPQCNCNVKTDQLFILPADDADADEGCGDDSAAGGTGKANGGGHESEDDEVDDAEEQTASFSTGSFTSSSKIDALMVFLSTCRRNQPLAKSVVFSQWTSMLDLIEIPLRANGFEFVRLDGQMSRTRRQANIVKFQTDPQVLVFLISTTAGAVGLNLTAASNAFLVDPWWNPQVERQAIDRVYRIGQTRNVCVVRFAVEDSVEERVLALQDKKRKMAEDAFGEGAADNSGNRQARLEDIRALLGRSRSNDRELAGELDDEYEGGAD